MKRFRGRHINRARPVDVYRNLQRGGYSLRQDGRVVAHTDYVMVKEAKFVVSERGHERFKRSGRRNVHAWVRGVVIDSGMGTTAREADRLPRVRYDLERHRRAVPGERRAGGCAQ